MPCKKVLRQVFIGCNVAMLIAGAVVVGFGTYMSSKAGLDMVQHRQELSEFLAVGGDLLAGVGYLLFGLAVFGLVGALTHFPCVLSQYANIVAVLFVVSVVGSTGILTHLEDIVFHGRKLAIAALAVSYGETRKPSNKFTKFMDKLQQKEKCCGVQNYSDYQSYAYRWKGRDTFTVPPSCCVYTEFKDGYAFVKDPSCVLEPTVNNSYISRPCYPVLEDWVDGNVTRFTILCLNFTLALGVLLVLSCLVGPFSCLT